ncbi:copper chaperone PCu(A)C [Falsiroseomonas sp.]|uniref:copper chaperone PCu(A)C n=1 Tax=Falsiroseomonas sp. TaxID=2870721 RepID=UPI003567B82A
MSFACSRRAAIGAAISLVLAAPARAQEVAAGPLRISAAWSRAMRAGGTGAGFMTIRNTGSEADRIVAARSPAARAVELHTHIREGDVMRMRPVPAIELPAGQEVRLAPGGLHLMLIGLGAALERGGRVPVTLVFERAGEVTVELHVESAGARGPAQGHGH